MFSGYWWFAAKTILQAKKSLNLFRYWWFAAKQFCRRKRLWIFPGCCWFAAQTILQAKQSLIIFGYWWFSAKTILQAKKTLNISRLLMICGQDNSAGGKIFEFFQAVDDLRLREICRRKSIGIFPGCWWFAAKTILQVKKSLHIFGASMICG